MKAQLEDQVSKLQEKFDLHHSRTNATNLKNAKKELQKKLKLLKKSQFRI